MAGVNKVILVGNVGNPPDVRRMQDGRPVVSFSIATSETWKDKTTGERKEATEWHRVVIFNEGLAKVAEQYVKKGSKLYVEGKQKTRKWTDQQGVERFTTETVLENFGGQLQLLDRAERAPEPDENSYGATRSSGPAPGHGAAGAGRRADLDDEIPF
jgi:single-strand DNA-binding protein